MEFRTLHAVDTEYSADTVEWCSTPDDYVACGTYQLVEDDPTPKAQRSRKGRIYLFTFDRQGDADLKKLQTIETAAILDMKWLPSCSNDTDSGPLLATVNALGQLQIYELLLSERRLEQRASCELGTKTAEGVPALALSLDWQRDSDAAVQLLVSDSLGHVHRLHYTSQGELQHQSNWLAHDFEAWTCAFDRWSAASTQSVVYSGGDDCLLHAYDLRMEPSHRIWTNREHSAGVTALLSHPQHEHMLMTGSYDDILRVFDTRAMKRSVAAINLDGGIWRLKAHPKRNDLILAACMYTNFNVVDLKVLANGSPRVNMKVLGVYMEHKSICYGADWAPFIDSNAADADYATRLHMATCSFYDHKLCFSRVDTNYF
ncbi:hypothetical protein KR093_001076 [Drosophila rubida]|uniref:methylated diphthine methylhydrolase n=1 Tax=Drosophila rubida TaxID=30044 RepID=A0AAD4K9P1_9MUSC|nr:hypothetical protein KR093_001076 [Drosophila rubida]